MDWTTIYAKTAKGVMELTGKSRRLHRELIRVLQLVDGKATVAEILARSEKLSEAQLNKALNTLLADKYIKVLVSEQHTQFGHDFGSSATIMVSEANTQAFLDAQAAVGERNQLFAEKRAWESELSNLKVELENEVQQVEDNRARKESETLIREELERREKAEAEARAQMEKELRTKAEEIKRINAEAEAKTRDAAVIQANLKAKAEAEKVNKARAEAADRVRREIDERAMAEVRARAKVKEAFERKAREDAIAKAEAEQNVIEEAEDRKMAELRLAKRLEARAKEEAEEKARKEAEEAARIKAEADAKAKAKAEAEVKARIEAEKQAREAAELRAREAAEALARAEAERQAKAEAEEKALKEVEEAARIAAEQQAREAAELRAREAAEALAREEAERQAKAEAEEKARKEAEERAQAEEAARIEAEVKAQAEAEEIARLEAEEQVRREIERKALEEAELLAREAEAKALEETEAKARRDAEESAKAEEAERIKVEAEAKAKEAAEVVAQAKAEAEKEARQEAEQQARDEVEAKLQAEARIKAEMAADAEERLQAEARAKAQAEIKNQEAKGKKRSNFVSPVNYLKRSVKGVKYLLGAVVGLIFLVLGLLHVVPLNMYAPAIEKMASDRVHEPVSISIIRASLWPSPHLKFEGVSIGVMRDVKIETVRVMPDILSLFEERKKLKLIECESLTLNQDAMGRIPLWLKVDSPLSIPVNRVSLKSVNIGVRDFKLPVFNAEVKLNQNGTLQSAYIQSTDAKLTGNIVAHGESFDIDFSGKNWQLPLGPEFMFDELSGKAIVTGSTLQVTEMEGRLYGGSAKGSAKLEWGRKWNLSGDYSAAGLELASLTTLFTRDISLQGKLSTKANYSMQAQTYAKLFEAPQVKGDFNIERGVLGNFDLVGGIQSPKNDVSGGGQTNFEKLSGMFLLTKGHYQYKQLKMEAGLMSANGYADVVADNEISGRINAELRSPSTLVKARFIVSGKLNEPALHRGN